MGRRLHCTGVRVPRGSEANGPPIVFRGIAEQNGTLQIPAERIEICLKLTIRCLGFHPASSLIGIVFAVVFHPPADRVRAGGGRVLPQGIVTRPGQAGLPLGIFIAAGKAQHTILLIQQAVPHVIACFKGGLLLVVRCLGRAVRFPGRIRHQTHRHKRNGDDAQQAHPEAGAAVVQHHLNPILHADLPEGYRASGKMGTIGGAAQEGCRIALAFLQIHEPHYPLVTGQLHVLAQQDIGNPYQGIKPVQCQGQEPDHLNPVVALFQMGALVGQDVLAYRGA